MSTPRPRRPPCASRPARPRRPRSTGTTRRPSKPRSTPGPSARSMGAWRSRSTTKASSCWMPHLTFPGLAAGEKLDRTTRVGSGAAARPRRHAAGRGPGRSAHLPVGRVRAGDRRIGGFAFAKAGEGALRARVPDEHPGRDQRPRAGLQPQLTGQPSGQLLAVSESGEGDAERILASGDPVRGEPVKTTIDPNVQTAAVSALGGTYGGVAVLDARNGDVLGIAGLAFSNPPGSTFKVVTATAALEEGEVKPSDTFPVETSNSLIGREISNAHDAPCGGTFVQSFAQSCNTVFAPRWGSRWAPMRWWKRPRNSASTLRRPRQGPGGARAARARIPSRSRTSSSARVRSARGGSWRRRCRWPRSRRRSRTRSRADLLVKSPELRPSPSPWVTSPEVAATMKELMLEVVRSGTGVAAQLPNVAVAGKTGTAELGPATPTEPLSRARTPTERERLVRRSRRPTTRSSRSRRRSSTRRAAVAAVPSPHRSSSRSWPPSWVSPRYAVKPPRPEADGRRDHHQGATDDREQAADGVVQLRQTGAGDRERRSRGEEGPPAASLASPFGGGHERRRDDDAETAVADRFGEQPGQDRDRGGRGGDQRQAQ